MEISHVILLCFLFTALIYLFTQNPNGYKPIFSFQNQCQSSFPSTNYTSGTSDNKDALETALSIASNGNNKTVIIAVVNKAYVEGDRQPMLDLFLESFWLGEDTQRLINHLVIVAVDQTSYQRCIFLRLNCYKLQTDGVDFKAEKLYMSNDFIKMMWRRTLFLGQVLKRGYNFIFTDTDILWLRNPFPKLKNNVSIDLQISTDKFNGKQWSQANHINTGLYMVESNNKTVALFDEWYARKNESTGMKEQDVLQKMIHEGFLIGLNLKVKFLDTLYFSGFCENSRDFRAVTTVHANCCRTINAKVADLKAALKDWKRFRSSLYNSSKNSNINETSTVMKWSNHVACSNSWTH